MTQKLRRLSDKIFEASKGMAVGCEQCQERNAKHLARRRARYAEQRRKLDELGILPARKPGRPRLRSPEEAAEVARRQKTESLRRTRQLIRDGLARVAAEASQSSSRDPNPSSAE